jgi:two-component system, OmpR family, sensor histidine kinase KdpD
LGLWIAATFIAANGGRLSAESTGPGLGTTMTVYLPARQDNVPSR